MLIWTREFNIRGRRVCVEYVKRDHKEIGLIIDCSGLQEMGGVYNSGRIGR